MSWLQKRDPFSELGRIQDEFNRAFNSVMPRVFGGEDSFFGRWSPNVDIYEDQNSLVLEADLPGLKPEDFKLAIENYKLTLSGERKLEKDEKSENYHRVERSYGSFTRVFTLPPTVDVENVNAEFKDGVLRVTLPKREEAKPRSIEVNIKSK